MIQEIIEKQERHYGNYFLNSDIFTEAPDDEPPVIKRNAKVIEVKPNNRKRLDFTDGYEDTPEDTNTDEDPEAVPAVNTEEDPEAVPAVNTEEDPEAVPAATDDTNTEEDPEAVPAVNTEEDPEAVPAVNTEEDPLAQSVADTNNEIDFDQQKDDYTQDETELTTDEVDDPNANTTDGDGPDVTNDEDFTAGDTEDPNAQTDDNANADDGAQPKKGPGLEYDSTRKYNLFENYISLSNAIKNYITKLENNMGDDYDQNHILKTATEKLREIYDLSHDYMIMKFEISTYVQSLLFFQNLVVMVQMVFDLVEKFQKSIKNNKS